jgi:hypothetical protein
MPRPAARVSDVLESGPWAITASPANKDPDSPHDGQPAAVGSAVNTATYVERVEGICHKLSDAGCEKVVVKNSWSSDQYKGINTRWRDTTSGELFELQFHTPESWAAKQQTHTSYERLEDPRTSHIERKQLREAQRRITSSIPQPPGCEEI